MALVECKHAGSRDLGQGCYIHYRAPALIQLLHCAQRTVHHHAVNSIKQVYVLRKLECGNRDELRRHLGDGRQLCLAVFLHHLAQLEELVGCAAVFVYRGIVVVACHVGSKTGRVGSCPVAEACSAVSHIQREADVFLQHLVHAVHHVLCGTSLVVGSPLVEPSAPELRAHQWCIRAKFFQAGELVVDIRTCTKVHRFFSKLLDQSHWKSVSLSP